MGMPLEADATFDGRVGVQFSTLDNAQHKKTTTQTKTCANNLAGANREVKRFRNIRRAADVSLNVGCLMWDLREPAEALFCCVCV